MHDEWCQYHAGCLYIPEHFLLSILSWDRKASLCPFKKKRHCLNEDSNTWPQGHQGRMIAAVRENQSFIYTKSAVWQLPAVRENNSIINKITAAREIHSIINMITTVLPSPELWERIILLINMTTTVLLSFQLWERIIPLTWDNQHQPPPLPPKKSELISQHGMSSSSSHAQSGECH